MKLFIGNLSYDTTEAELREIFAPFEPILELSRPYDRSTGKPRGFAFVTLVDQEKGNAAIAALNGTQLAGREIRINEAESRAFQPPRQSSPHDMDSNELGSKNRVDDRPKDKDGKKVSYKSI